MTTDEQIRKLRMEAQIARDIVQVVMCDRALGRFIEGDLKREYEGYASLGYTPRELAGISVVLRMSVKEAERECLAAIRAGNGSKS